MKLAMLFVLEILALSMTDFVQGCGENEGDYQGSSFYATNHGWDGEEQNKIVEQSKV